MTIFRSLTSLNISDATQAGMFQCCVQQNQDTAATFCKKVLDSCIATSFVRGTMLQIALQRGKRWKSSTFDTSMVIPITMNLSTLCIYLRFLKWKHLLCWKHQFFILPRLVSSQIDERNIEQSFVRALSLNKSQTHKPVISGWITGETCDYSSYRRKDCQYLEWVLVVFHYFRDQPNIEYFSQIQVHGKRQDHTKHDPHPVFLELRH